MHVGRDEEAIGRAKRLIATFESAGVDAIVVNAAGCGSSMKDYRWLLRDVPGWGERAERFSATVRDVHELLVELGPRAVRHPVAAVAAYHDACHLANAQGVRAQPRALLAGIPALELREVADPGRCCGSAGVYNLLQPAAAGELGARKAGQVAATGADLVLTANPGCQLQLAAALADLGRPLPVRHPVEVLDASIRGVPLNG
jgi:glycolate oxidase iron-sulfur subunit